MAESFGKYELLTRLAIGGMAEIHLARQKGIMGFERFVVLKKVLSHLAEHERFLLMFFEEARIAARLHHPNVIQVLELGEQNGEFFISMEYLQGQNLATVLQKTFGTGRPLPAEVAVAVTIQACDGLHYAHQMTESDGTPANLVHRDISPQNLFVLYSGVVKVVDFGLAQVERKLVRTRTGVVKGKYAYMSPEQVAGKPLDRRSDIFSAGVVLWEALVGRRLFYYDNDLAIAQAIVSGEIDRPRSVRRSVPEALEEVVMRALARDPADRFQSAADFQQTLLDAAVGCGLQTGPTVVAACMQESFSDIIAGQKQALLAAEQESLDDACLEALRPGAGALRDFVAADLVPEHDEGAEPPGQGPVTGEPEPSPATHPTGHRTLLLLILVLTALATGGTVALLMYAGAGDADDVQAAQAPEQAVAAAPAGDDTKDQSGQEHETTRIEAAKREAMRDVPGDTTGQRRFEKSGTGVGRAIDPPLRLDEIDPLAQRERSEEDYRHVCRRYGRRERLGMVLGEKPVPGGRVVVIRYVCAGSTAEQMGLRRNDLIASLEGEPVHTVADVTKRLAESAGSIRELTVLRGRPARRLHIRPGDGSARE